MSISMLFPYELRIVNYELSIVNYSNKKWLVFSCEIELGIRKNGVRRVKNGVFHRNIACYERNYMTYEHNYVCYEC